MKASKNVPFNQKLYDHQEIARKAIIDSFESAMCSMKLYKPVGEVAFRGRPAPGFLLHDEVGLGKTKTSLSVLHHFLQKGEISHLLVCPASAKGNWFKQAKDCFGDKVTIVEYTGTYKQKRRALRSKRSNTIIMMTYSTISRMYGHWMSTLTYKSCADDPELGERVISAHKGYKAARLPLFYVGSPPHAAVFKKYSGKTYKKEDIKLAKRLFTRQWTTIILDEVHRAKDKNSNTAKALAMLKVNYRLGLTATPIVNRMKELCTIFSHALGYIRCPDAYCSTSGFHENFMLGRKKENIKEFRVEPPVYYDVMVEPDISSMDKAVYMTLLAETKRDYKMATDWYLTRGMTEEQARKAQLAARNRFFSLVKTMSYSSLHNSVVFNDEDVKKEPWKQDLMDKAYQDAVSNHPIRLDKISRDRFMTLALCIKKLFPNTMCKEVLKMIGSHLRDIDFIPSGKMLATLEIYKNMIRTDPEDKMIIFSDSRRYLEKVLTPWLNERGINSVLLVGGSKKKQNEAMRKFKEEPDMKVLCTIKSVGGLAHNFQAVSSTVVISDLSWSAAKDDQAVGRVNRIGQRATPKIFTLMWPRSACIALRQLGYLKNAMAKGYLYEQTNVHYIDRVARNLDMNMETALTGTCHFDSSNGMRWNALEPSKNRLSTTQEMLAKSNYREMRKKQSSKRKRQPVPSAAPDEKAWKTEEQLRIDLLQQQQAHAKKQRVKINLVDEEEEEKEMEWVLTPPSPMKETPLDEFVTDDSPAIDLLPEKEEEEEVYLIFDTSGNGREPIPITKIDPVSFQDWL